MAEPNRVPRIFNRQATEERAVRGWNCPREEVVAAYLDQALEAGKKGKFERHLANCLYCSTLVADVVKLERLSDLAGAPAALIERVRSRARSKPGLFAWNWLPVATAGTLACAVLAVLLRTPAPSLAPNWPAPAGPAISKSEPSPPAVAPGSDSVRRPRTLEALPTIISPPPNSIVSAKRLEIRWHEVPDALYYQVRLVTPEGDLVWQGDATEAHIALPERLALEHGKYFVLVSAVMDSGRSRKAPSVGFGIDE